jgi:FAD/FMN-containing dehydrogenase
MGTSLLADLGRLVKGTVHGGPAQLAEVSDDFGGLVHREPGAVVVPSSAADVAAVLVYAGERGLAVSSRGIGHSMAGQSLCEGGILLDTRALSAVELVGPLETAGGRYLAGAGATWAAVLEASLEQGLVPPVVVSHPALTVGGTTAMGGLGRASFREGAHVDGCLGLEVVTPRGEVLWCTPDRNRELFDLARAGLGQAGVITRVEGRLRRHRSHARTDVFLHASARSLLEDLAHITRERLFDHVEARWLKRESGAWQFLLYATTETDTPAEMPAELFALLNRWHVATRVEELRAFLGQAGNGRRSTFDRADGVVRPGMDALLPWSSAESYLERILREMPAPWLTDHTIFPLLRGRLNAPLFMAPDSELVLGVGFYPELPRDAAPGAVNVIEVLSDALMDEGGKRYPAGWMRYDAARWRRHYGVQWPRLVAGKRAHDPQGILNRGFVVYDDEAAR